MHRVAIAVLALGVALAPITGSLFEAIGGSTADPASRQAPTSEGWNPSGPRTAVVEVTLEEPARLDVDDNATVLDASRFDVHRRARSLEVPEGPAGAGFQAALVVDDADGERLALLERPAVSARIVNASAGPNTSSPVATEVLVTVMADPPTLIAEHWDLPDDRDGFACAKAVLSHEDSRYSSVGRRPTVTVPVGASSLLFYGPGQEGCPSGQVRYAFLGLWTVSSPSGS